MVIIRPTASLAKRMRVKLAPTDVESTTRLGDWYAMDIVLSKKQFVLCVSSTSRLSVVLEAAPYASFPKRLPAALSAVLRSIGVSESDSTDEINRMSDVVLAKTVDRSIIGSMNEHRFQLQASNDIGRLNLDDPFAMSLYLGRVISLVLPEGYPYEAALKRFDTELRFSSMSEYRQPSIVTVETPF